MSDITTLMMGAAGQVGGDYQISRSLRFNRADVPYLDWYPASASNQTTWTWAGWIKRGSLGTEQHIFEATGTEIYFASTNYQDTIHIRNASTIFRGTEQLFRDTNAFLHLCLVWDTGNATPADRCRIYVNGVKVTSFYHNTDPTLNQTLSINSTNLHRIGQYTGGGSYQLDGYLADVYFLDGITPGSATDADGSITGTPGATYLTTFGEFSATTGVWTPKAYSGSYGTNGFHLDFSDNSNTTATTLGKDSSGNGNNWTPNNFSVTAGAGNDSLVDVPTRNTGDVDTGAGGEVRGNFCTWNALYTYGGSYANGNLEYNMVGGVRTGSTMGVTSGKWYCEIDVTDSAANREFIVGVCKMNETNPTNVFGKGVGWYASNGNKYVDGSASAYGATYANGDRVAIALDVDGGTVTFYKNGSSQGSISLPAANGAWNFVVQAAASGTNAVFKANWGQRSFINSAPTNFKALCTTNLSDPTILEGDQHFNTVLWTGDGATTATPITGVGFQPDFVWIKERTLGYNHVLQDAVRGVAKKLGSNLTSVENDGTTLSLSFGYISSFDSDGFTLESSGTPTQTNRSGSTYVGWNWKANGAGVSNTDGTITSTVSVNQTAGFSIVAWTGDGNISSTVGHGLGTIPAMLICKERTGTDYWHVQHKSLATNTNLFLNNDLAAFANAGDGYIAALTSSTTFGFASNTTNVNAVNQSTVTNIAYVFAEVPGFSAFGSYTGNGSADGPFVYTGFRPAFVLWKNASVVAGWFLMDSARSVYNVANTFLRPNAADAEGTAANSIADFTSNGFKIRGNGGDVNGSGNTIIYMAFAENPFKYALAR